MSRIRTAGDRRVFNERIQMKFEWEQLLYKKTSKGSIQVWRTWIESEGDNYCIRYSESGKVNGKLVLTSSVVVPKGKNTTLEQGIQEAESKYEGKKKEGYVTDINMAQEGQVDTNIIKGGYPVTLAKSFEKEERKIVYPCYIQPKLDGHRATYSFDNTDNEQKMFSRTRKSIISVPHIPTILSKYKEQIINLGITSLDGELYNHDYKDNFEELTSIINQKKTPAQNHTEVEYHIYDVVASKPFYERYAYLKKLQEILINETKIKVVTTSICLTRRELIRTYENFLNSGYEGGMCRSYVDKGYSGRRSSDLLKMKIFEDAEFEITGVEEVKKSMVVFHLVTTNNTPFKAKMKGSVGSLKKYLDSPEEYIGKMMTVKFQGFTKKNQVPRFPIAERIRTDL